MILCNYNPITRIPMFDALWMKSATLSFPNHCFSLNLQFNRIVYLKFLFTSHLL